MHELQHDRAILLAVIKDLLDLSETLEGHPEHLYTRRNIVYEASRISSRLIDVQKRIEEQDLD